MPEQTPEIPIRFYRTAAGREPVLDWLRKLDKADRRVIGFDLTRVQFGWPIGMPLVRNLGDGLCELRSDLRSDRLRQENPEDLPERARYRTTANEGGYRMKKSNPHIGSSLEDFLKEEGILEEARAAAIKEAVAFQVQQAMKKPKISKVEMARRMKTSRAALDRLLAPGNASVTLQTLARAARAIGRDLRIELV